VPIVLTPTIAPPQHHPPVPVHHATQFPSILRKQPFAIITKRARSAKSHKAVTCHALNSIRATKLPRHRASGYHLAVIANRNPHLIGNYHRGRPEPHQQSPDPHAQFRFTTVTAMAELEPIHPVDVPDPLGQYTIRYWHPIVSIMIGRDVHPAAQRDLEFRPSPIPRPHPAKHHRTKKPIIYKRAPTPPADPPKIFFSPGPPPPAKKKKNPGENLAKTIRSGKR